MDAQQGVERTRLSLTLLFLCLLLISTMSYAGSLSHDCEEEVKPSGLETWEHDAGFTMGRVSWNR